MGKVGNVRVFDFDLFFEVGDSFLGVDDHSFCLFSPKGSFTFLTKHNGSTVELDLSNLMVRLMFDSAVVFHYASDLCDKEPKMVDESHLTMVASMLERVKRVLFMLFTKMTFFLIESFKGLNRWQTADYAKLLWFRLQPRPKREEG